MTTPKIVSPKIPVTPVPPSELATRISPVAGFTLAAFMAVGLLSCAWLFWNGKVELLPPNVTTDEVLHGDVTHKIAKQLSGATLAQQAANLERAASWLVFNDTGPRVRQGCPGWLFIADELKINRHAQANADAKAQAVIDLQQRLAKRGVKLLVAVVPDKSRIASEQLCGVSRPAQLRDRVSNWTATLHSNGVNALDLTSTLEPIGAKAYLRTDTHWSETGADAAAEAVAAQVRASGMQATPQKSFDVRSAPSAPRPGDLVRLAGIDWLPLSLQPTPESVAASEITERAQAVQSGGDNLDDLFGDDNLPNVALIGTSFSRNSNFAGFLQLALGAPIGNFGKDGGEFSGAANVYFDSPAFKQTPPQLLIWEIPERDLQTPYEVIKSGL
ncbi:cell division protein FtsQ [Pseudomonas sp. S25]|uniref:Cell division protein FtsQ n=1 Tax=Pseudomonas maioricensis TaxID=1766623 RepID=A0ABS9ZJX8_9PSED|nr:cell division protein FtsQ [Pseudomonas sp. S25]MCI8210885.1 cell division protein FtsQ [Pseudomonas sp. S25]